MLLISRALVSSSGCGWQSGCQGPPPAPTACHGRVGHHSTALGAGKAASRGCGNISGGAPSAAVQRRKQGPQGCPLQLHPSLPGPPTLTVPGSPRPHLTFPAACLRNRAPDTSQTPTAQALGTEHLFQGGRVGTRGADSTVWFPQQLPWPWWPHTPFLVSRRPQRPFSYWGYAGLGAYVCKCTPVPV